MPPRSTIRPSAPQVYPGTPVPRVGDHLVVQVAAHSPDRHCVWLVLRYRDALNPALPPVQIVVFYSGWYLAGEAYIPAGPNAGA